MKGLVGTDAFWTLQRPDRLEAVFAANDPTAIRLLSAAAALDVPVPDELAVVGFREQHLLQADRDIVHWRYHDDVKMQIVERAWGSPIWYEVD